MNIITYTTVNNDVGTTVLNIAYPHERMMTRRCPSNKGSRPLKSGLPFDPMLAVYILIAEKDRRLIRGLIDR